MADCNKDLSFGDKSYRIKILNNSDKLVLYSISFTYPDTIIPDESGNLSGIKANDFTYNTSSHDWSEVLAEKNASKISFFFFNPDTITKYGWSDVKINYRILCRKDISLQELIDSDYIMSYP
jgi:hypothetical protein